VSLRLPVRRPVGEADHARLVRRPGVDAQQAAAAQLDERCVVEHLDLEPGLRADDLGDLRHPRGGQVHRWRVREVPGDLRRLCGDAPPADALPRFLRALVVDDHGQVPEECFARLVAEPPVAVPREEDPFHDRLGGGGRAHARDPGQRSGDVRVAVRRPGERRGGVTKGCGIEPARGARPDGDELRDRVTRDRHRLADGAREPCRGQRRPAEAERGGDVALRPDRDREGRDVARRGCGDVDNEAGGSAAGRDRVKPGLCAGDPRRDGGHARVSPGRRRPTSDPGAPRGGYSRRIVAPPPVRNPGRTPASSCRLNPRAGDARCRASPPC
jgi:hypothetical protein